MHANEPSVFAQVALVWQLSLDSEHSFMSTQCVPLPLYPWLHGQLCLKIVSVHSSGSENKQDVKILLFIDKISYYRLYIP